MFYKQTITRKGSFDSAHRVMNEKMKCFNLHGHTYLYELEFLFTQMEDIGYAIDFKEIKRIGCQWIDDVFDHGTILNPKDQHVLNACTAIQSKVWFMSLNGAGQYCNPSVENIAKEIFLGLEILLNDENLKIHKIRLYETPNCYTECFKESIRPEEFKNFMNYRKQDLEKYKKEKGTMQYDDRK